MNLNHDFVQVSKLSEHQKKRSSLKMEHFFSPNSSGHVRSDAHQSQIIGGDADVDHTQTIGGDIVKLLGGYIPPPGFGTPESKAVFTCLTIRFRSSLSNLSRLHVTQKSLTRSGSDDEEGNLAHMETMKISES